MFIPDDIFDELLKGDSNEQIVLFGYAMLQQREGTEPEVSRVAEAAHLSLEVTQNALTRLSEKGWLERVKDYSE